MMLEVLTWLPKDANLVSMSTHLLGRFGKIVSWALYLLLFYSLTVAYISFGGSFVGRIGSVTLSPLFATLLFVSVFAPIVHFGAKAVGRTNFVLMIGLIVSYFLFILVGFPSVNLHQLPQIQLPLALLALPVIFTSFSFQGVVPSLVSFLKHDFKAARKAIIMGSSLAFLIYVVWEVLILGIVPTSDLIEAAKNGQDAVAPLSVTALASRWNLGLIGHFFAFFALTTSFLGVTLGLIDFLKDGLSLPKTQKSSQLLFIAVFAPTTLFAMFNPGIFLKALTYAGGLGCALLLGLLPVILVWIGRYHKKLEGMRLFPFGRIVMSFMIAFVLLQLYFTVIVLLNHTH